MNKRIRELAEQAELNLELQSLKVEKFAELIVKECIRECEYARDNDALHAAEAIKEHFGVDE